MTRWTGPGRFTAQGDSPLSLDRANLLRARARQVVGQLEAQVAGGQIWYGSRVERIDDHAYIIATVNNNFGNQPLVEARIFVDTPQLQPPPEGDYWVIYALRGYFPGGNSNISGLATLNTLSQFTYVNGMLTHNWEYQFGTGGINDMQFAQPFFIDIGAQGVETIFRCQSALFSGVATGWYSCNNVATRFPETFVKADTVGFDYDTATYSEVGAGIVPSGVFTGVDDLGTPCSFIFTMDTETAIADLGWRWESPVGGNGIYKVADATYLNFVPAHQVLEGSGFGQVAVYSVQGDRTLVATIPISDGGLIDMGGGFYDQVSNIIYQGLVSNADLNPRVIAYDVTNGTYEVHHFDTIQSNSTYCYVVREGDNLYMTTYRNQVNYVYRIPLDTLIPEQLISRGENEDNVFNDAVFRGLVVADNGDTIIVGNGDDAAARTAFMWVFGWNGAAYELREMIPSPAVAAHPANNGVSVAGFVSIQYFKRTTR